MSSDELQELERAAARAQEAVNNPEMDRGARAGAWMALQRLRKKIETARLAEMRRALDACLCPSCRGLGWVNPPEGRLCLTCCGSGWQNEETIRWLVNELRKRGVRGGDDGENVDH